MTHARYQRGFRKLIVWQEAHCLTKMIYKITVSFPKSEMYEMTKQLRNASSSIGAQIAEGSQMRTQPHRKLYYERAYSSASEVDNFLELSLDLNYLKEDEYKKLLHQVNKVSYLLQHLRDSPNA
ncbi:four helix bundle protein [Patescibacteria group bacterium]|nr:four helix bundle protein [Patescibacteria group bacterium]MBU1123788.1 four helix bundle protein [Patescibacteria group bacterium]MBU1911087.1 four helix bundle protein [Patescibacteria group bacterium]